MEDASKYLDKLANDEQLKRLQADQSAFNLFEAAGLINHEIRHSTFLAFLLNPRASHGLGTIFAARFLNLVAPSAEIRDLTDLEVHRERWRIDIAMISRANNFGVVIENKIWSGEHGRQLETYFDRATKEYPGLDLHFVYLSPGGVKPKDPRFQPISYREVEALMDDLADTSPNPEVSSAIRHYRTLIKRHIVDDKEIERICQEIYKANPQALNLINKHVFQKNSRDLIEFLKELILEANFELGKVGTRYVIFFPPEWSALVIRGQGKVARPEAPICFYFSIGEQSLSIRCNLRPSSPEIRSILTDMLSKSADFSVTRSARQNLTGYPDIYSLELCSLGDESQSLSNTKRVEIRARFMDWAKKTLPMLTQFVDISDEKLRIALGLDLEIAPNPQ